MLSTQSTPPSQTYWPGRVWTSRGQHGGRTGSESPKALVQQNLVSLTLSIFKKTNTLMRCPSGLALFEMPLSLNSAVFFLETQSVYSFIFHHKSRN